MAVLTLALGIGANTAIFSVVENVLLRPLPYPQPESLVRDLEHLPPQVPRVALSPGDYADWRREAKSFSEMGGYADVSHGFNLTGDGEPQRIQIGYAKLVLNFSMLGRGWSSAARLFREEDRAGSAPVVLLKARSDCGKAYGGDPQVVGRTVTLDNHSYTIAGILPAGFQLLRWADMWMPLGQFDDDLRSTYTMRSWRLWAETGHNLFRSERGNSCTLRAIGAAEFILEGLHVHNKLNKAVKAGRVDLPPLSEAETGKSSCRCSNTRSGTAPSSSCPSRPTRSSTSSPSTSSSTARRCSANLDDLDEDEMPEIVELIQKEGLIEKDEEGKWRVTPKGVRRIQDKALGELFQTFRRDSVGRHDTQQKGEGTVRLEDTRPYVYGDSLANLNLHETLKNAYVRQGGGVPIQLSHEDYVVHETEYQTRCATVVLIDMSGSMGRYGKYYTTKKVALALQAMVRAQYPQDSIQMIGFYTFASPMTERQLLNSAPKPVSMYDSRIHLRFDLDKPPGPRAPALHQHPRRPAPGAEPPDAPVGGQQADHRDHRRRADGPHRGPRGRADLSPRREDRDPHAGRGHATAPTRASASRASP